ncbi:MAG: DUF72 domain-containing protein [Acidobacteriia bacterium]|nr:DUF72 domain-containing protein [Terriglobia bacterium]
MPSSKLPPLLHLGTSSWSSDDWVGPFYPEGTKPNQYIVEYAKHFETVEMDATWHHMPSSQLIRSLDARTPSGFIFSAKAPDLITHQKYLVGCEAEVGQFLETMALLGDKLGPFVFQFPYVAKGKDAEEYRTGNDFVSRLAAFLPTLPTHFSYVVEVRNSNWLKKPLLDVLKKHNVALALTAYYTMPSLEEMLQKGIDPVTAAFTFVRFIGHRKQIDALIQGKIKAGEKKREFDELIVDRRAEMSRWISPLREILKRGIPAYVYFNNHYGGFGPGSARLFTELWEDSQSD